ncbi:hypothetical protein [Paenibacillus thiaminolyticus]|uniref:hypothetical protein n=1 Tax=Paenibacillus thiaminolyticus TaxID=49283 RepID=UPI001ABF6AEB|nr:hypothetical protein [Paenibacillus thiaminolyticus]MCY9538509.1 hypothetical protein [Paenibacillus thiaminolyticus]MCY9600563.1 hypothetical protein [Paenibacillus thiaminolyticus]MCY9614831.1 hypothetical protein [Paenibacillus thiaminolyticus]MCY9619876.1 hypothetical protein [Paenibacillus thiaminolyticus]MCY9629952.1 hypothetical protein [Paenibacillus thiaminolyticus]
MKSHIEDQVRYVEDVAVIQAYDDDQTATRELVRSKDDELVYHTAKERSKSKLSRCSVSEEIMISIEYKDGLLFTSLVDRIQGCSEIVDNMVIDTCAAETILSPDAVVDLQKFTAAARELQRDQIPGQLVQPFATALRDQHHILGLQTRSLP